MEHTQIKEYVEQLSWDQPEEMQKRAIRALSTLAPDELRWVLNSMRKDTWENAVQVIANVGYPGNQAVLPDLFWLLQDLNWPGSAQAMTLLASLDRAVLIPLLEAAFRKADREDDAMWIGGLNRLAEATKLQPADFQDARISEIRGKAAW